MLHPLSVITYFNQNKKKILPIIAIITLSSFCLVSIASIIQNLNQEAYKYVDFYKRFYSISINDLQTKTLKSSQLQTELSESAEVDHVLANIDRQYTTVQSAIGDLQKFVYYLNTTNYDFFMQNVGWQIKEGRLPQDGTNEIVLSESILKNKGLKIGDNLGSFINREESLVGSYKIVGSIKDTAVTGGLANLKYYQLQTRNSSSSYWYLVKPKKGQEKALDDKLNKIVDEEPSIQIWTQSTYEKFLDTQFDLLNKIIIIIMVIILATTTFSIAMLQIIFYGQRIGEFGILSALGYPKRFLIRKTVEESLVIILVSWFVSIGLIYVTFSLLNKYFFEPKGMLDLPILHSNTLFYSLPAPICVLLFSCLIQIYNLVKMDTVQVVEKRD